ncbi:MAG: DUF115 domain-containing protein [Sulfurimonas sp.]|uniref:motility associated factor glycosyltransferase family protein n=1 Tax=Sulfurimonas sp. TaxID=2022749 RepID=UPI002611B5F9|nr:6-hydroxymethylpterin diphosphokinase MptE-like protein [Sulfurimonas sp.]MDD3475263.1 DUF115 domain-containing protein [Sulfurimonas sp.]
MRSIEKQAITTFQKNLDYFKEKQPKVYEKIAILNQAIKDGSYKEKYALEYKNSYFDVLDISSNQYLYNQDSNEYSKVLTQSVNFKKSDSVIEGFYNRDITKAQAESYDGKININNQLFATAALIHYTNSVTSKNDEMKEIFKFIFLGVGLGLHLNKIQKKINSSLILIVEDNLELFRLSLFTTDYQNLSIKARVFFSIMDNEYEFKEVFTNFFTEGYLYNHYIKYSSFTQNDMLKIKTIQDAIVRSNHLIYPYSVKLKELLKAPEYLVEKYPFLNLSKTYSSVLSTKPVLLIASGPSLGNNSAWLQENKDKFFIIAVLSSVKTLYKIDVKPDVVLHMDSQSLAIAFFDTIDKESFFDKTIFLLSSVVSRNVVDAIPKEQIYFFETASNYKQNSRIPGVPSIGEASYAISLILGAKELYLLGLDLALDPETGNTHTKDHAFFKENNPNNLKSEQYTSLRDTVFYTKGNFLEKVPTNALFDMSAKSFNVISKIFLKNEQNVYNLNNGAYLEGAIPLHSENLDTSMFDSLSQIEKFKQLKTFLDEISENHMNESDIKNMDIQIEEAARLLRLVQEFKNSSSAVNKESYLKEFYALYIELLNISKKEHDINHVFSSFLQNIVSYIFDILNTKQLKDEQEHIRIINQIYIKQLIKILDLYLITMRIYREWIDK